MSLDRATLGEAAAAVRAASSIVVVGHVGPDGDALGSMLALSLAAREAGKDSWASFGEPFVVQRQFDYLDQSTLVAPGDLPDKAELFIAVDTAAQDRLGSLGAYADRCDRVLVIDHHRSNGGFGDIVVVDPEAAATTQLVWALLREIGWPIDEPIATALYTGLVTDTGRFQYPATTPEVHEIAADLLAAGVDQDLVARRLFEEAPFGYYEIVARVMGRAVLEDDRRLVWSYMTQGDLDDSGVGYEDTDPLIDLVRIAEEAGVACLLKEIEPGVYKGSLRSRGRVDVSAVAQALGGGGHHNAAGFTFTGTLEEAIDAVRAHLS